VPEKKVLLKLVILETVQRAINSLQRFLQTVSCFAELD
jgi:hypothetical protein